MKLKKIFIKKFNAVEDLNLNFDDHSSNLSILIGKNGSGKTTILRCISEVFRGINNNTGDRFNGEIWYRIKNNDVKIVRALNKNEYYVNDKRIDEKLFIAREKQLIPEIIVSAFSIHNEFKNRPYNYSGLNPVKYFDIGDCYGKNHFGGRSISKGLARLADDLKSNKNHLIHKILNTTGISQISIYSEEERNSQNIPIDQLMERRSIEKLEESDDIYVNDITFSTRSNLPLSLSNMSSGQKIFMYRMASLLSANSKSVLFLIEEPELHLDPRWCKQITSLIEKAMLRFNSSTLITTHHHSVAGTVESKQLFVLEEGRLSNTPKTLLGSENEIIDPIYDRNSLLNDLEKKYLKLIREADAEELKFIIERLAFGPMKIFAALKLKDRDVES
jgi:predicted ATP-binding protein involved in virulence